MLCGAIAMLSGCSALRIAYGTAPDLVYWWLDGYVDFTDDQTPRVRESLKQWFAWHRRTQLPDYAALLTRAQVEITADTTPARVCEWQGEITKRAHVAFDHIAPATAELMLTSTAQQLQHLERRYLKYNDKFRDEYLQRDPRKRSEATLKRAKDRIESLYGDLDDSQVAFLADALARSPFDPEQWLEERKARQQLALQMAHRLGSDGATKEQAQAALRTYIEQLERSPRPEYRRYVEKLAAFNCNFAARLHNLTRPDQRRFAVSKLDGWAGDLRALAAAADQVR